MKYVLIFSIGLFVGVGLFTLAFQFFQNPDVKADIEMLKEYQARRGGNQQQKLVVPEGAYYNQMLGELTGGMGDATASLNDAVKAAEGDLQGVAGQLQNVLESFKALVGQFEKDSEPVRQNLEDLSRNLESALTPQPVE